MKAKKSKSFIYFSVKQSITHFSRFLQMLLFCKTIVKKRLLFIFFLLSLTGSAQAILSGQAEIAVITCGPSQEELYSAFGHSAIRVRDSESGLDLAYNYGVFKFDTKFYFNFTRGNLLYNLGVYPYTRFRDDYIRQNRYINEQILNLTPAQKQQVMDYLPNNTRPENATYRYDYFYYNCATKVRDVLVTLFGDRMQFNDSYAGVGHTIRDLTAMYLTRQPWGKLGIDICLGLPMDKKLTALECMFLPDFIESGFDHATLNGVPIVKKKILIYKSRPEVPDISMFHPWAVFGLFLLITTWLSYHDWKKKRLTKWFDCILFSILGWVGVCLAMLWVATDHQAAAKNFNLLWAFPFHAIAGIWLVGNRNYPFLVKYFMVVTILSALTLLLWSILPQHLNVFLIPLVLASGIRAFVISAVLKP
ncbi:DUF4105 domain-containing protein [Dyadobacter sp. LHD-138]|uniref:lipoprotein N-acyltransferase Lnb domain-containing protein n=1 Tax=Dyadobacter sp. LHD-138 TaxID=3071413 RepID=UPI0027DF77C6|nr:DUF4105 domain-containing protein [Dyadobacter sp. LHD-138]MDQ6481525.1 DUF4105 domain-containing protein [Dyadobacter sp. LHD-138]